MGNVKRQLNTVSEYYTEHELSPFHLSFQQQSQVHRRSEVALKVLKNIFNNVANRNVDLH